MNVASTSTSPSSIDTALQSAAGSALGSDAFMKLLVTQMQNQDPMAPMDNQAQLAQLAQFSSLSEMQELNDNVVGLAVLQQNNALLSQLTQSSALIGQEVHWQDAETGDEGSGIVDSVKLENGLAMLSVGGEDVPLTSVVEVTAPPVPDDGTQSN